MVFELILFILIVFILNNRHVKMDLIQEQQCAVDKDCDPNYYCYQISKRCVNFTTCSLYNRVEGETPARSVEQCGCCISGYVTEILADGKESPLCQRNITEKYYQDSTMDSTMRDIIITSVILVIVFISVLIYLIITKFRRNKLNYTQNDTTNTDVVTNTTNIDRFATASAPEEQNSFIKLAEDKYHVNNRATNEYQTSRVSALPQWEVLTPPREPHLYNNFLAHYFNIRNIGAPLQNNISDNQSTEEVAFIELPISNIEQEDNARNTTLLQTNSPDSDTDSSSEPNEKTYKKKNNIIINQSVSQGIKLKVYLTENEC